MSPRHGRVSHFAGDLGLRDEVDRLRALRIVLRHSPRRRPGVDHRHFPLQPRHPLRHRVEVVVAGNRRLVLGHHLLERLESRRRVELRLHRLGIEKDPAVRAKLLHKGKLVAGRAGLAEIRRPVHVRGQLVGDELRHLRVLVPALGDAQRLAVLRLVRLLQLRIPDHVLAVVEAEFVAVVKHSPALSFVRRQELVQRMVVVEIGRVHVSGDELVDRLDDPPVGEGGNPGRLDIEDVVGAGVGDVLRDRLGVLVGMRKLDHVLGNPRQRLPLRARVVLRFERLQAGLIGDVEGGAFELLGGLHRPVRRSVGGALGRCRHGRRLGLPQRRVGRRQFHLGRPRGRRPIRAPHGGGRPGHGGPPDELGQLRQERSPGRLTTQPGVDVLGQPRVKLSFIPPASATHPVPPICRHACPLPRSI